MTHFRLFSLWRDHRAYFAAIVAIRLVVAATWIAQALAMAGIFAVLLRSTADVPVWGDLNAAAAVLAAALAVRPVLVLLGHVVAFRAMSVVKSGLRACALRTLVDKSARDPRGRSGGDHALVVDGIENLDAYLSGYLPQVIVTGLTAVVIGGTMVALDPIAGIAATLVALMVPLLPRLWERVLAGRGSGQWEAYQNLQAEFVDSMNGMTTLVAFGAERRREQHLAIASAELLRRTISQLRLSLVDSGLAALALVGAPAAVLLVITLQPAPPTPIVLFSLVLLAVELVRPLRDLAALWHAGYIGTFSGTALLTLLAEERPGLPPARSAVPAAVRRVEFRDVVVRHPGIDHPALFLEHLVLEPGLTAIVGPSGAGKSTLGATIVGLAELDSGSILLNGHPSAGPARLRAVSLVPQDPSLFGGTVAEEIARGADDICGSRVATAAANAGIGTDDATLTLDSVVGEGGALLSGGQRQRVAIARALIQQRPVLVLDEATSALDPASEAALISRLRSQTDQMLIAITHRAAVAHVADRIITINGGRIQSVHPVVSEVGGKGNA